MRLSRHYPGVSWRNVPLQEKYKVLDKATERLKVDVRQDLISWRMVQVINYAKSEKVSLKLYSYEIKAHLVVLRSSKMCEEIASESRRKEILRSRSREYYS